MINFFSEAFELVRNKLYPLSQVVKELKVGSNDPSLSALWHAVMTSCDLTVPQGLTRSLQIKHNHIQSTPLI